VLSVTLFCYGSLEFAEVMRWVTRRSFPHEPARLAGWVRLRLRGRSYPGLRPRAWASTPGTLWRGIDEVSAARLDAFEGALYQRRALSVRSGAGVAVTAQVYVVAEARRSELSNEPWDKARFARAELAEFLRALNRA
jgi:gamma-glutamylcyclotransferase (GGCT)/AIG2-like uncharacterized protein YtfP